MAETPSIEQVSLRDALWDAVKAVYRRHDEHQPLNHVNVVEWVDAVERIVAERVTQAKAEGEWLVETLDSTIISLRVRLDAVADLADDRAFIHGGPTRTREALLAALNGYVPGSIRVGGDR